MGGRERARGMERHQSINRFNPLKKYYTHKLFLLVLFSEANFPPKSSKILFNVFSDRQHKGEYSLQV